MAARPEVREGEALRLSTRRGQVDHVDRFSADVAGQLGQRVRRGNDL